MKYISISVCLVATMLAGHCTAALPIQDIVSTEIESRSITYTALYPYLSIVSGEARCEGLVSMRDGYNVFLSVSLMRNDNIVKTWSTYNSDSGGREVITGGYCDIEPGYTYSVKATISVYNASGVLVESASQTSLEQLY